ncbi:NAD-binding protein [Fomitiporia mediterranea MF3/22]|uniref:NAD-binding protein n=1 Tax=Fomitiporia mediterranea (strain MF3/22) TaxID=694068 RepID=UPI0004407C29|nr:NAD-binding protein [Fomitiporia mediterranea MF3/22]EJD02544.1 NAD-binding protein [Fomitiporia mediterranea MF3/22]
MSHTTSAMLSRAQSSIVVAGATGRLGYVITETLLTTFKPFFHRVVALTRDASLSRAQTLAALGAEVTQIRLDEEHSDNINDNLRNALKGTDIVVNVLGVTSARVKDVVAEAAIEAGVKVYFPSEFGVDHRLNDFPGFDHPEWIKKRKHLDYVNEIAAKKGDVKIISVYNGLFLEDSFNVTESRYGVDLSSRTITALGSPSSRATFTSKVDIARSVAQLAILAMLSPATLSDNVPSHVHISGCTRSAEEIAHALSVVLSRTNESDERETKVEMKTEDIEQTREKLKSDSEAGNVGSPPGYIRVLMGEGKLDFSAENVNELVNPSGRLWKWKSVEEALNDLIT